MWTVVYVSQSAEISKKLVDVLLNNGVISKVRRGGAPRCGDDSCYEVLVPSTELEAAQNLIFESDLF